jgi:hypothetical protein
MPQAVFEKSHSVATRDFPLARLKSFLNDGFNGLIKGFGFADDGDFIAQNGGRKAFHHFQKRLIELQEFAFVFLRELP